MYLIFSPLTISFLRNALFNFYISMNFLNFILIMISIFIPCDQRTYFVLFLVFNCFKVCFRAYVGRYFMCTWEVYVLLLFDKVYCEGLLCLVGSSIAQVIYFFVDFLPTCSFH